MSLGNPSFELRFPGSVNDESSVSGGAKILRGALEVDIEAVVQSSYLNMAIAGKIEYVCLVYAWSENSTYAFML